MCHGEKKYQLHADPTFYKNKKILAPIRSDEVEDIKIRRPLRSDVEQK